MERRLMMQLRELIPKAYDLHVHIGPEIIPRRYTAQSLVQQETGRIAGMALKNHFFSTVPLISEQKTTDLALIGSVVLNTFVGGLNPDAIYAASTIANNTFIVWFPTMSSAQFLKESEWEIAPEWIGNKNVVSRKASCLGGITLCTAEGTLTQQTMSVLKSIQSTGAILATGHISWEESRILVKKAYTMGITQIIITHPIYQRIQMPLDIQQELVACGAVMEHCFSMYSIDKIPISSIARQIKHIGANNCILSTDVGQTFSPSPSEALYIFATLLMKEGITVDEITTMIIRNPFRLINTDIIKK